MGISPKSRLTAALLGLLLGFTGAHNFYLEKNRTGSIQLVLSVFTFGLAGCWGEREDICTSIVLCFPEECDMSIFGGAE